MAEIHASSFPDRAWRAAEFESLLVQPSVLAVHKPGGFILARLIPPEAEILTFAVHPQARRQGCGRALLASLLDALPSRSITHLLLEVAADNDAARALYAQFGFIESGRRRGYYQRAGHRVDAVMMQLAC